MDEREMFECGICYFQGRAKDFTPITVSANFAALECPKCLNNHAEAIEEFKNTHLGHSERSLVAEVKPNELPREGRESIMAEDDLVECGICHFQGTVKEFSPTTVSAKFLTLECPKCLNNDADSFEEIKESEEIKAA